MNAPTHVSAGVVAPDMREAARYRVALFRHVDRNGWIALRVFDGASNRVLFSEGVQLGAEDFEHRFHQAAVLAATTGVASVLCPPLATFNDQRRARTIDLREAPAILVECDTNPTAALANLTKHLGRPTLIVASGGQWVDPATGEVQPKLHLYWRLTVPARTAAEHQDLRNVRKLACDLVGADPSAASLAHPIRWAGTPHRKAEPCLARIVEENDLELDLGETLARLQAIPEEIFARRPIASARAEPSADKIAEAPDVASAVAAIRNDDVSWDDWNRVGMAIHVATKGDPHEGFEAFDGSSQRSTKYDAEATEARWDHYSRSPPDTAGAGTLFWLARRHDPSWVKPSARVDAAHWFEDPETVSAPLFPTTQEIRPKRLKTLSAFLQGYVPLEYAVEPLMRTGSLYSLTARTGAGKTAFLISAAYAVITGRQDIIGLEVERGRVAYLTFENPDDVRMRMMVTAHRLGIDTDVVSDRLLIIDTRDKPEAVLAELAEAAAVEPLRLIVVDTFAAFFDGDNVNDPVQGGEFMRRLRPMTRLPGLPAVVVASHPVKNASEEQLVPYGSGAILNEVDGNLTLWRRSESGTVKLHWQGKLRGLEFEPREFRFEISSSPDVLDAKSRLVKLPTLLPAERIDAEAQEAGERTASVAILQAMDAEPTASQRRWADLAGCSLGAVSKHLPKLASEKLVSKAMGHWSLTPKGQKELQKWT